MIKYMSRLNAELAAKVKEAYLRPAEIHNHFGSGCSAQVFNDKVTGKFVRKEKKRKWKKMVRKML